MEFVQLNYAVLLQLKARGYNILTSTSSITSESPTWMPDEVDLVEFLALDTQDLSAHSVPMQELHLLLIDDALQHIAEEDLLGQVFMV